MPGGAYGTPLSERLYGFANLIGDITGAVREKGVALVQALGTLVDRFAPGFGAVIGALGGLFGKIFGKKKQAVDVKVVDPVVIAPSSLSYALGANPASAIFGMRGLASGAGYMVQIGLSGDAKDLFYTYTSEAADNQAYREGV